MVSIIGIILIFGSMSLGPTLAQDFEVPALPSHMASTNTQNGEMIASIVEVPISNKVVTFMDPNTRQSVDFSLIEPVKSNLPTSAENGEHTQNHANSGHIAHIEERPVGPTGVNVVASAIAIPQPPSSVPNVQIHKQGSNEVKANQDLTTAKGHDPVPAKRHSGDSSGDASETALHLHHRSDEVEKGAHRSSGEDNHHEKESESNNKQTRKNMDMTVSQGGKNYHQVATNRMEGKNAEDTEKNANQVVVQISDNLHTNGVGSNKESSQKTTSPEKTGTDTAKGHGSHETVHESQQNVDHVTISGEKDIHVSGHIQVTHEEGNVETILVNKGNPTNRESENSQESNQNKNGSTREGNDIHKNKDERTQQNVVGNQYASAQQTKGNAPKSDLMEANPHSNENDHAK